MWDLPRPGLEPVSPALAGRFSTTAPPGKPPQFVFNLNQRHLHQPSDPSKPQSQHWTRSRGTSHLFSGSAVTILKFLIFEQGVPQFYFAPGPTNYVAVPVWKTGPAGFLASCISRARQGSPQSSLVLPVAPLATACSRIGEFGAWVSSAPPLLSLHSPLLSLSLGLHPPLQLSLLLLGSQAQNHWPLQRRPSPFPAAMVEALYICGLAVVKVDTVFGRVEITVDFLNPKRLSSKNSGFLAWRWGVRVSKEFPTARMLE